jgi:copper chaperone CopZ
VLATTTPHGDWEARGLFQSAFSGDSAFTHRSGQVIQAYQGDQCKDTLGCRLALRTCLGRSRRIRRVSSIAWPGAPRRGIVETSCYSFGGETVLARVTLDVPALHCEGCIISVSQVLEAFGGVHSVEGDLEKRQLTVDYDLTTITPQAMAMQLESVGYPVTSSHGH